MEVTDAFTTAENVNFSLMLVEVFSLTFLFTQSFTLHLTFYLCQILLEETPDSPLSDPAGTEDGLVAVHIQAVDSPARQTTDGEGVTCSICSFATNMN